jgi:hypothetical protein
MSCCPPSRESEAELPPHSELAQHILQDVVTDRDLVVKGPDQLVPHGIGGAPDVGRSPHQTVEDDEEAVAHSSIRAETAAPLPTYPQLRNAAKKLTR